MKLGLDNRTALLLGGSGPLGAALGAALVEEGAEIVVASRRKPSTPGAWHETDLADTASVTALIDELALRPPSILVSMAAVRTYGDVSALSDDDLRGAMAVKVWAPARIAEALGPEMASAGWGRMLFIGGIAAHEPVPRYPVGGAVNAAVRTVAKGLAMRWPHEGVTVNAVSPGPVRSARLATASAAASGGRQAWLAGPEAMPAGRYLEPDEVAAAIAFLVSERASGINGAEIVVDGGALLGF